MLFKNYFWLPLLTNCFSQARQKKSLASTADQGYIGVIISTLLIDVKSKPQAKLRSSTLSLLFA